MEQAHGFYAETLIQAANPAAYQHVTGLTDAITQRHIIINCFTPIDDCHIQLVQWLFRNDTEADCPEAMLMELLARHGESEVHRGTATMAG